MSEKRQKQTQHCAQAIKNTIYNNSKKKLTTKYLNHQEDLRVVQNQLENYKRMD